MPPFSEGSPDGPLSARIAAVVENELFVSFLQPIFNLRSGNRMGYELLNRPYGLSAERFYSMVPYMGHCARMNEIALRRARRVAEVSGSPTFVNIFPTEFREEHLELADHPNLVLEFSEQTPIDRAEKISGMIRSRALVVALDDFGKAHANFSSLFALEPAIVKLDRSLISGIHKNGMKRDTVELLAQFSRGRFGLIAEGVERKEELELLSELGIPFAQGFLLGQPKRLRHRFRP